MSPGIELIRIAENIPAVLDLHWDSQLDSRCGKDFHLYQEFLLNEKATR
jgi:hypothetical protein